MKKFKNLFYLFLLVLFLAPISANAIVDNPLTHLEVETQQGTGNFNVASGQKSFSFGLSSSYSYANIIAKASNETYVITGAGHVECQPGMNVIKVVVTDPADNTSATYTINLNFSKKGSVQTVTSTTTNAATEGVENPSTGAKVNLAIITSGALLGSIMFIGSKKKSRLF